MGSERRFDLRLPAARRNARRRDDEVEHRDEALAPSERRFAFAVRARRGHDAALAQWLAALAEEERRLARIVLVRELGAEAARRLWVSSIGSHEPLVPLNAAREPLGDGA